jgi:hypothetical protein
MKAHALKTAKSVKALEPWVKKERRKRSDNNFRENFERLARETTEFWTKEYPSEPIEIHEIRSE